MVWPQTTCEICLYAAATYDPCDHLTSLHGCRHRKWTWADLTTVRADQRIRQGYILFLFRLCCGLLAAAQMQLNDLHCNNKVSFSSLNFSIWEKHQTFVSFVVQLLHLFISFLHFCVTKSSTCISIYIRFAKTVLCTSLLMVLYHWTSSQRGSHLPPVHMCVYASCTEVWEWNEGCN